MLAYCALPIACARETDSAEDRGFEVIVHDGPLPALGQDALTPAEVAFRAALEGAGSRKSRYALWGQKVRAEWMSARGLVKA